MVAMVMSKWLLLASHVKFYFVLISVKGCEREITRRWEDPKVMTYNYTSGKCLSFYRFGNGFLSERKEV